MNNNYLNYLTFNKIHCPCRICGNPIVWDNSRVTRTNKFTGKTHKLSKNIQDHTYHLSVCQSCFESKFGTNKTNFNVMCGPTKWAFNISDDDYQIARNNYAMTLNHMISKYGEEEGRKKWNNYCARQAETNSFEYKNKIYGWSEQQFKEYNVSRAVTLQNLIKRHGEEEGRKKWDNYCARQAETKSWDYMVKRFGEEQARLINIKKAQSGGCRSIGVSKISQELFRKLDAVIQHKCFYHDSGGEQLIECSSGNYLLDFYVPELKICVEFNGSIWHADPRLYGDDEKCNPMMPNLTAKQIRDKDNKRYEELLKEHNIKTFVVWELDYNKSFNINDLLNTIKEYYILYHEN